MSWLVSRVMLYVFAPMRFILNSCKRLAVLPALGIMN